jgi:hypothetical protein
MLQTLKLFTYLASIVAVFQAATASCFGLRTTETWFSRGGKRPVRAGFMNHPGQGAVYTP